MANFSNYYENVIIDHMIRGEAFVPPTNLYIALFTGDAAAALEANNPTTEISLSGTAYERKEVAFNAASNGTTENTTDIEWNPATTAWGNITYGAIVDHATNINWGTNVNVLMWGALNTTREVGVGDVFKVLSGQMGIEIK